MRCMKKLIDIAKYITAVGVIGGGAIFLDNIRDGQGDILDMVEYNSAELSMLGEGINDIGDTLVRLEEENKVQSEKIGDIVWLVRNQKNYTDDQFDALIDRMLKKNSMTKDTTWDFPWRVEPSTELILSDSN